MICDQPSRYGYVVALAEQVLGDLVELYDSGATGYLLMVATNALVMPACQTGPDGRSALRTLQRLAAVRASGAGSWPEATGVARDHDAAVRAF